MSTNTFSNEIESSIIAGVLQKGDLFSIVIDVCEQDDFYWKPYKWVYDSFLDLYDKGLSIDFLTVSEEMSRHDKLESFSLPMSELRGLDALKHIYAIEVNLESIETYALQCHDDSAKRKANKLADDAKKWINEGFSGVEIATKMEYELGKISAFAGVNTNLIATSDTVLDKAISDTEYASKGNKKYIETGLTDLDYKIGGLFPEQLITIAGRQGEGKSSLAMTIALNVSTFNKWKKKVGIFSLEMSNAEYMQRMISAISGISSLRLKMGKIYDNEWEKYEKAVATIRESKNIFFDDTPHLTVPILRNKMRKMCDMGVELFFLDQLGLMSGGASKNDQEYARVDRLSYQFKGLAREFSVPFVNVQQMSRAIESMNRTKDSEPKASDLSQSGESSPNLIIMIRHQKERKVIKSSKLWIVKNRDGATGDVDVKFEAERTYFRDLNDEEKKNISNEPDFIQSEL
jgi:replicative DNA helicase